MHTTGATHVHITHAQTPTEAKGRVVLVEG